MKMKPTSKDFYMEIRKSPGRFLSILFIVALGVAFFSGIRASEPDMRLTGDTYFDESNLMDIKALSTYGVTQDDVDAILKIDGVEHAEGAYSADFMQVVDKKQKVLHVISLQDEMNQVKLSDGRMPQKAGECLADQDAGYKVGDTIKLRSGTSDEVTDTLTTDTLKVVGLCSSPMYISYGRGSATIGTGTISAFVMVPEETFDMDVYTEVYVQVKGAKNEVAFTDGYDKKVEKVLDQIEDITDERAEIRKQELVNEAQEKIDEAREELEQGRADAASELADAAAKIADAEEQLTNGKAQITSGKKQIASAKNTLSKKESELEQAQNQYNAGLAQLQEGEDQYEAGLAQYEAAKPEAEAKIQSGREGLAALQQMIQADQQTWFGTITATLQLGEPLAERGFSWDEPIALDDQFQLSHVDIQALSLRLKGTLTSPDSVGESLGDTIDLVLQDGRTTTVSCTAAGSWLASDGTPEWYVRVAFQTPLDPEKIAAIRVNGIEIPLA